MRLLSACSDVMINTGWILCGAQNFPSPGSEEKRNTDEGETPCLKREGSSTLVPYPVPHSKPFMSSQRFLSTLQSTTKYGLTEAHLATYSGKAKDIGQSSEIIDFSSTLLTT